MTNYYKILELEEGASADKVRASYWRLLEKYHSSSDESPYECYSLWAIQEAYDVLTDNELHPDDLPAYAKLRGGILRELARKNYDLAKAFIYHNECFDVLDNSGWLKNLICFQEGLIAELLADTKIKDKLLAACAKFGAHNLRGLGSDNYNLAKAFIYHDECFDELNSSRWLSYLINSHESLIADLLADSKIKDKLLAAYAKLGGHELRELSRNNCDLAKAFIYHDECFDELNSSRWLSYLINSHESLIAELLADPKIKDKLLAAYAKLGGEELRDLGRDNYDLSKAFIYHKGCFDELDSSGWLKYLINSHPALTTVIKTISEIRIKTNHKRIANRLISRISDKHRGYLNSAKRDFSKLLEFAKKDEAFCMTLFLNPHLCYKSRVYRSEELSGLALASEHVMRKIVSSELKVQVLFKNNRAHFYLSALLKKYGWLFKYILSKPSLLKTIRPTMLLSYLKQYGYVLAEVVSTRPSVCEGLNIKDLVVEARDDHPLTEAIVNTLGQQLRGHRNYIGLVISLVSYIGHRYEKRELSEEDARTLTHNILDEHVESLSAENLFDLAYDHLHVFEFVFNRRVQVNKFDGRMLYELYNRSKYKYFSEKLFKNHPQAVEKMYAYMTTTDLKIEVISGHDSVLTEAERAEFLLLSLRPSVPFLYDQSNCLKKFAIRGYKPALDLLIKNAEDTGLPKHAVNIIGDVFSVKDGKFYDPKKAIKWYLTIEDLAEVDIHIAYRLACMMTFSQEIEADDPMLIKVMKRLKSVEFDTLHKLVMGRITQAMNDGIKLLPNDLLEDPVVKYIQLVPSRLTVEVCLSMSTALLSIETYNSDVLDPEDREQLESRIILALPFLLKAYKGGSRRAFELAHTSVIKILDGGLPNEKICLFMLQIPALAAKFTDPQLEELINLYPQSAIRVIAKNNQSLLNNLNIFVRCCEIYLHKGLENYVDLAQLFEVCDNDKADLMYRKVLELAHEKNKTDLIKSIKQYQLHLEDKKELYEDYEDLIDRLEGEFEEIKETTWMPFFQNKGLQDGEKKSATSLHKELIGILNNLTKDKCIFTAKMKIQKTINTYFENLIELYNSYSLNKKSRQLYKILLPYASGLTYFRETQNKKTSMALREALDSLAHKSNFEL